MDSNNTGYRIMNLEGAWLTNENDVFTFNTKADRKYINNKGVEITVKADDNKIFTATMPYSLETIRAFELLKDEEIYIGKDKATKLFINCKFTKKDIDNKIEKKQLRKLLYTKKVIIDDIEYCFFKRGASKARTANVIFVKKEYKDILLNPCLLGLKFEEGEEYDVTSKEAYTSLIMSGIIGTIEIQKDEILIINDIISPAFKAKQTVTKQDEEDVIYQEVGEFNIENNTTDGQAMLDESIFENNEFIKDNVTALLRNDFTKADCIKTKLQAYYTENNITQVWDMYRGWIDASKIKLVITPSSCKYLKFKDQYDNNESDCFKDWLDKIPTTFGVVKTDHIGNYGYSNRLSYQMINSMNLSMNEVRELMKDELDYIKLLKDNVLETSDDIKKMNKQQKIENRNKRNDMSYFLDLVINENQDEVSSGDMISDLLNRNSDFRFTSKFKKWKSNQIDDYISNLRLGKIRIKNSLYAIMVSCPYEMLVSTTKENNNIDNCIMSGYECWCPRFDENKELMGIRNPQINEGNICSLINKYHDEYKWFGQSDFVVFINSYDCDIMNRLQGCDWDVDTCYLTDNSLLVSKSKYAQRWYTPTNGIKGNTKKRLYTNESLADLDNYLGGSTMSIGKIVNKSAIFNAYMYNAINKGYSDEYVQACYEASSTLSSFSQIAIDMAKKSFEGLSLTAEMTKLNKTYYINKQNKKEQILKFKEMKEINKVDGETIKVKKMIVPYFFTYTANDNSSRIPTYMDCGMDYLEKILDEFDTKAIATNRIKVEELLVLQKDLKGKNDISSEKIDNVRKIINKCQYTINKNCYNKKDSKEDMKLKLGLRKYAKKIAIKSLQDRKLNEKTILKILERAFNLDEKYSGKEIKILDKNNKEIKYSDKEDNEKLLVVRELSEMTILVLTLIYNSYPKEFINCFKEVKYISPLIENYWE